MKIKCNMAVMLIVSSAFLSGCNIADETNHKSNVDKVSEAIKKMDRAEQEELQNRMNQYADEMEAQSGAQND